MSGTSSSVIPWPGVEARAAFPHADATALGMRSDARTIEGVYPRDNIRTRFHGLRSGSFGSVGACLGVLFPRRHRP
jgi:hypothetical protein